MTHFVVKCRTLEGKRDYNLLDKRIEDPEQRLIDLLYEQRDHQGVGAMIKGLWNRRKKVLENMKKMDRTKVMEDPNPERVKRSDPGPVGDRQPPIRRLVRGNSAPRG